MRIRTLHFTTPTFVAALLALSTGCSSEVPREELGGTTSQQTRGDDSEPSRVTSQQTRDDSATRMAQKDAYIRGMGCFLHAQGPGLMKSLPQRVEVATECCDLLLEGGYFENATSVADCKAFVSACADASTENLLGVQDLDCPNPITWRRPTKPRN